MDERNSKLSLLNWLKVLKPKLTIPADKKKLVLPLGEPQYALQLSAGYGNFRGYEA